MCEAALCPDCAAVKVVGPASLVACARCGERAEPLLRPRREVASLARRLPDVFRFPFRGEGLPAWLGLALWLWVTSFLGSVGLLVGWGAALGSLFGVTRSTARGGEHLELSDFQDPLTSVAMPVLRFALALAPAWGGSLLAGWLGAPWLHGVAVGLALVWSPTAFIGAATGARVVDLLNPLRVLGATARLGPDFGVYVVGLLTVTGLMAVSVPLSWLISTHLWAPGVAGVLAQMALLYGPLVGARLAGVVLLLHGPAFGWGVEADTQEPVLPGVEPRGRLPAPASTRQRHLPEAIELEPEPSSGAPSEARVGAGSGEEARAATPLDAARLPSHGAQVARALREALGAGRVDEALDALRDAGAMAAPLLNLEELLRLGAAASERFDDDAAEVALREAAGREAPAEQVAQARVLLARVLAERRGQRAEAMEWMERVVAEQPGTAAAATAASWLRGAAGEGAAR